MNIHQWRKHVKTFNAAFEKNKEVRVEWNENTIANIPRFNKKNSIWNLEHKYIEKNEKAFILVGGSPSLKKDVHKLKEIDDNFRIMCANSSLRFLLANGVRPHYVICLDSDKIDIPQHLDCDSDGITLLASSVVHGSVLDAWKGPIWFMPYYSIDKELRPKIRAKLGKTILGGGNSMTQALVVATLVFGSKIIIFAGNEYCFDKSYYADTTAAKQEILKTLYPAVDVLGKHRWTLTSLFLYAAWTEKACSDLTPPGLFIDTSFGLLGKDCDAIHNIEITEAINLIKQAFNHRKEGETIGKIEIKKHDESKVLRYDVSLQREKLLRLARG